MKLTSILIALAVTSCVTTPEGKHVFDGNKAAQISTGVISLITLSQNAPVPETTSGK